MHPTLTHTNSNGSQMNIFSESTVQIKTVLQIDFIEPSCLPALKGKVFGSYMPTCLQVA